MTQNKKPVLIVTLVLVALILVPLLLLLITRVGGYVSSGTSSGLAVVIILSPMWMFQFSPLPIGS